MAAPAARVRARAWLERQRLAALAERMLEVDQPYARAGEAFLSPAEAAALRAVAERLGSVPR